MLSQSGAGLRSGRQIATDALTDNQALALTHDRILWLASRLQ
jgi:hypothetical protein